MTSLSRSPRSSRWLLACLATTGLVACGGAGTSSEPQSPATAQREPAAAAPAATAASVATEAPVAAAATIAPDTTAVVPPPPAPAADPSTVATEAPAVAAVPPILQISAPLVGGGDFDFASLAGQPVAVWFWAPG